jgi:protein-disulfide isomerase
MDKKFILILAVIVAAFVGFLTFGDKSSAPASVATSGSNHVYGNPAASVEIVEFGDFQCPACGQFFPIVKEIKQKYDGKIKFVYKNFPLDSIHPNARAAHRSAEAAGNQGKFFEMHDLLYENQRDWQSSRAAKTFFEGYAKQIGLDMTRFEADFAAEQTNAVINADSAEGKDKKVSGTPTFFINGKKYENNELGSVALFSAKIDELLATSSSNTETSTPAAPSASTDEAAQPVTN